MKDSGIPWIGQIPESWEVCKVKNFFVIGRGRVIDKTELSNNGLYPVYSSQTKHDGILGYIDTYDFDTEQLTWTTDGVNAGTIFLRSGKYNCTNVCGTLLPKSNANIKFCKYFLEFNTLYYKRADTNGFKIMNNEMADISLLIPLQEAQQKIVEILDKKCGRIDELIKVEENAIEKLKEYKTSLITKVVTKGLAPNAKMKDSGIPWIGQIPHDWEVGRLKNFYINRVEKYNNQNFDYFALENIESWSGRFIKTENFYNKQESILCYKNDCVFGKLRPYLAKAYLVPNKMCCSSEFAVFYSKINSTKFLFYCFVSFGVIDIINSSTYGIKMPRANIEFILNLQFVIPNISNQQQIVEYLDKKCDEIDVLFKVKQEKIEKLKEYKKSLIYQYVTGKKEVV